MDRQIQQKPGKKRKRYLLFAALGLMPLILVFVLAGGGEFKVERERIRIAVVEHRTFDDVIAIQGNVEPVISFFLDAVEGGTIQEVYVEAGIMVEKGQSLLRLSNTQLMLDFMNRETQIVEQINNLRNTRMQMELNERSIRSQVLDIAYEKETMERQFGIDTNLYASAVIAKQQYEDSHTRYKFLKEKEEMLRVSFEKDEHFRKLQFSRIDRSIEMMERNLEAIRANLENLTVKAPITGQLTSFDIEIGESKMKGENLGRIDVLDNYLVKARVDEHYLSRVETEQTAAFMHSGRRYPLRVSKVLPEVNNNQFEVEFEFADSIPQNVRRGQTLAIRLALSSSVDAIVVPRGAFYSSTGGKWVYVLDGSNTAIKRQVTFGRQNPDYIEVLDGLRPGESIISSSYDIYSDYETISIEN